MIHLPPSLREARHRAVLLFLLPASLLGVRDAGALVSCPGAGSEAGYKVLLDEISSSGVGADAPSELLDRLHFKLTTQLGTLVEDSAVRPDVVKCKGRKPGGATDFDRDQVDQLNSQGVLLEIWGTLQTTPGAASAPQKTMLVGYALVPLRYYEHFVNGSQTLRGVYQAEYSSSSGPASNLLQQSSELPAFTALGVGLKAMKTQNYDQARKYFCKAAILLDSEVNEHGRGDYQSLLEHARKLAAEVVATAIADSSYQGALRLPQPAACAPR